MRKQTEAAFDGPTLALPELSAAAAEFVQQHPDEARVAVTAALEAVAGRPSASRTSRSAPATEATRETQALRTHLITLKMPFACEHFEPLAQEAAANQWPHVDYFARIIEGEAA